MLTRSGYLEWDSDFLGFPVAFIEVGLGNELQVKEELDRFLRARCRLVYVFSHKSLDLSDYDSCLADRKRSYILTEPVFKEVGNHHINIENNAEMLYELAYQAGIHSRYRTDPHFSEDTFKRLYRIWIDNSINKGFADYVLASIENDKAVGLITAKRRHDEISIGLFATDHEYRGKGIGSKLIQEVINIGAKENLHIEVTTQADNMKACKFYEDKAFQIKEEEYVYHVWNLYCHNNL